MVNAQRLLKSLWAILKNIGKLLGNAQITGILMIEWSFWRGKMKIRAMRLSANRRQGRAELSGYQQKCGYF
jgi:hypothetical protein